MWWFIVRNRLLATIGYSSYIMILLFVPHKDKEVKIPALRDSVLPKIVVMTAVISPELLNYIQTQRYEYVAKMLFY